MTRRSAMEILGAGSVAGAALVGLPTATPAANTPAETPGPALQAGTRFGRWTIARVHEVERGALRVDVREDNGAEFPLEILARDPAATRPPAEVGALAIYVCNGGNGWTPTVEEQGLAAMTLAKLLDKRGETGAIEGLLSHGDRVLAHRDVLHADFIPA